MSELIFFDTETTGIPDWKIQSDDEKQPHMVQLAAVKVDKESKEIISSIDLIIKPTEWVIPQETIDIHGITNDHAMEVGMSEKNALAIFLEFWGGSKRIAFNTTFDNRIIRIATKRYANESIIDNWKAGDYECAMIKARKIMGGKNPKLSAAYKHFTGKDLENAHTAMADALACMSIYFAIEDDNG